MTLLPRVYLQPHTAKTAPVIVHGNTRDELDILTAERWYNVLHDYLHTTRLAARKRDVANRLDESVNWFDANGFILGLLLGAVIVAVFWVI